MLLSADLSVFFVLFLQEQRETLGLHQLQRWAMIVWRVRVVRA